jgi:hypothetical protein
MLINENTDTSPAYRLPTIIRDKDTYSYLSGYVMIQLTLNGVHWHIIQWVNPVVNDKEIN